MLIKLVNTKNGRLAPVAVCDVCNQRIKNANMANVVWEHGEEKGALYLHKSCDNGTFSSSMELSHFLFRLVYNSGMSKDALQEAEDDTQDLSLLIPR